MEKIYLSKKITQYIEKHYYQDINNARMWDNEFDESIKNSEDYPKKIEYIASNGFSNLHKFYLFCKHHFEHSVNKYLPSNDALDMALMNFYLTLLCYFHNCYDPNLKHSFLELSLEKIVAFFYHPSQEQLFLLICSEHKSELEEFRNKLNFSDTTDFLREILILPFLLKENIDEASRCVNPQELITHFHKQIANNPFLPKNTFLWFSNLKQEDIFINLLGTLYIFWFLKQIFYLNGDQKIFGYYQRLLDKEAGNVIYSIPYRTQMFLLRGSSALAAGEANISQIEFLDHGDLLINFKNGLFNDESATNQMAFNIALAFKEYLHDCVHLFDVFGIKPTNNKYAFHILIETPADNPYFTDIVLEQIKHLSSQLINIIKIVPALKIASADERKRYLITEELPVSEKFIKEISDKLTQAGHKPSLPLSQSALMGVKLIELMPSETLMVEGEPSLFVYIALSDGLVGYSEQAQIHFNPNPWTFIGNIGLIRNDTRSATIYAEKKVKLLMIPNKVYFHYWHDVYTMEELRSTIIEKRDSEHPSEPFF